LRSEARQEEEAQAAEILRRSGDSCFALDAQWRFTYLNPAAENLLGCPRADLLGRNIWDSARLPMLLDRKSDLEGALATRASADFEVRSDPNGAWFKVHLYPLQDGLGVSLQDITSHKQAEAAAREREEQFRALSENARSMILVFRGQDILYANPYSAEIAGYSREELQAAGVLRIVHPDFHSAILERYRRRMTGETLPDKFEYKIITKSGTERWIASSAARVVYQGMPAIVAIGDDITELKQTQSMIRSIAEGVCHTVGEEFFRWQVMYLARTLDTAYSLVGYWDPRYPARVKTIAAYCRGKFLDNFEYDLRGTPCEGVLGGGSFCYPARVQELFPEDRLLADMGAQCYAGATMRDTDGKPMGIVAVLDTRPRDAVELKEPVLQIFAVRASTELERLRTEGTLRASEAQARQQCAELDAIYQNAPVGLCVLDPDLRCLRINRNMSRLTGLPEQDYLGKTVRQIVPHLADRVEDVARRVLGTGHPVLNQEITGETRGEPGSQQTWMMSWVPLRNEADQVIGINAVAQEITDRKRAEEALRAARDIAETANRAKDQFLAVLSHELRTPLTAVIPALGALGNHLLPGGTEYLEIARRNVEMEVRLIDDLLDVTRIVRGKVGLNLRLVDLCRTIRQAAEVCAPDLEARRLKLDLEIEGDPLIVNADPTRLLQVFWNLLKNSVKFSSPERRICIRAYREQDLAIVEVIDSGDGIEPEAMGHIFNAFAQAETGVRRKFGGLGLGLYISKAIVEMHGGTIRAYSAGRGQGAIFTVKLPVAKAQAIAPAAPAAVSKLRPLKILLVEDHADSAKMLGLLLKTEGHEVTHAGDVATALKFAGDAWCFDVLISDIGLPDGTGYDLMRELTARGMEVPAIALSGYGMAEDVEKSMAAGFHIHLTKPADLAKLREAMASTVARRERV